MANEAAVNSICALVEAFYALARPTAHFPDQFAATAVGFVLECWNIFSRLEEREGAGDGRLRPVCVNDVSSTTRRHYVTNQCRNSVPCEASLNVR